MLSETLYIRYLSYVQDHTERSTQKIRILRELDWRLSPEGSVYYGLTIVLLHLSKIFFGGSSGGVIPNDNI